MNVAFTRARTNLWVVGHAEVLKKNEDWSAFILRQQSDCRLLRVTEPHQTFLPRYLSGWYDRHPEEERPACAVLDPDAVAEPVTATAADEAFSDVESDDDRGVAGMRPDIEEMSSDDDFGG